jgi:hypothetical protein
MNDPTKLDEIRAKALCGLFHRENYLSTASSIYLEMRWKSFIPEARAIRAADEAAGLVTVQGWQLIGTAPKDGSPSIFFSPGNKNAEPVGARKSHIKVDRFSKDWPAARLQWPEAPYTHWMHLPPPPVAQVEPCPVCDGSGKSYGLPQTAPCGRCDGTGKREASSLQLEEE